jgi:hypothetical protein
MLLHQLNCFIKILVSVLFFTASFANAQADPDPKTQYFVKGQVPGSRGVTLGDPQQWVTEVKGLKGESAGGKVKMVPEDFRSKADTMRVTWSADPATGNMAIYGANVDLAAYKDSSALMFDVKVHAPPSQAVEVGLDCGYPCRATFEIGGILRSLQAGRWTALPIPLACLKSSNFDLSKINGVFLMATSGSLDVSITNIRLQKLPEGFEGCPEAETESAAPAGLNPDFFYFAKGKIIGARGITLGDPSKWGLAINGLSGESASGKVQVEPEDFQEKGDALHISWSKKDVKGELAIFGPPINIAPYKDFAALTFDVKVNTQPKESVMVGMDCGYPCRAEYEVGMLLRKLKKGAWTSFPIPLNCLKSSNFELGKINGVFVINTSGKLDLSIANIRLEKLPEGSKTCKD